MKEKFVINREKLKNLINKYEIEIQGKNEEDKDKILKKYSQLVIDTLGTDALKEAIGVNILKYDAESILNRKQIHKCYSDKECLEMLEGLSNYEIVGDWQQFRTIKSEYLFKLPRSSQEVFAENFSIGNNDAKECLLKLWERKIKTTGTDVIRKSSPKSINNITIECRAQDMRFMMETLRKNVACKRFIYASLC